jgi:hypothetical protein
LNVIQETYLSTTYVLTGHFEPAEAERPVLDYAATATGIALSVLVEARTPAGAPARTRRGA